MWKVKAINGGIIVLSHTDKSATPVTDYHRADALARKMLGSAKLYAKGTTLDRPMRAYYAT